MKYSVLGRRTGGDTDGDVPKSDESEALERGSGVRRRGPVRPNPSPTKPNIPSFSPGRGAACPINIEIRGRVTEVLYASCTGLT